MKVTLMKKNKDPWSGVYFHKNCKHQISSYWTRNQKRYTGLTPVDRERLEAQLEFKLDPDSAFWDNFNIELSDRRPAVTLDTAIPFDELRYKFLTNHKDVANGYNDRKAGASYVLVEEKASAEEVIKKADVRIDALIAFRQMTIEQMRKCLRLFGHRADQAGTEVVKSALYQIVEENPSKFISLWVNNENKELQYIIEEAASRNILRKNKTIYKYGTDIIGHTLEDAIDYLKDPANSTIKLGILSQIQGNEVLEQAKVATPTTKTEISKIKDDLSIE
jgi:hypothetical protein